ncbi:membrane protein [Halocynthiibacter namhaensis]|uniref:membrane protein n=1 Tax=Halocynthiibacter namhaensis TaxID=1290553 RepID=UPI00057973D1|nr:membrane protein [Halocynthiibacter namhaensis]
MVQNILFDPLIPASVLIGAIVLSFALTAFAAWRGLAGWVLRMGAAGLLLLAIANPSLQQEEREPLNDVILALVDETASQTIGGRSTQTATALADLRDKVSHRGNSELRVVNMADAADDQGSKLIASLTQALADIPANQIAGVIAISDGVVHDMPAVLPALTDAPFHLLQTGRATDRDRRLTVKNAPGFAIMGEEITLTLRIDDLAAVQNPASQTQASDISAPLVISVDGADPITLNAPIGRDFTLPFTLPHGGMNTLQFATPMQDWELTDRNNQAILRINGVRDRLRVLLISGEPHAGERVWRNLLKSDSSVDLVHFTILRPPEKQDGVPVDELALIAFPTHELFIDKIDEFDLIIFDRYKRRGILPGSYFDSVRDYVTNGGAVLVAAGPDYASVDSLWYSSLSDVLPAGPTGQVLERGYLPSITDLGQRHPVTRGLNVAPDVETPPWGRWLRQTELVAEPDSQTIMSGNDTPLLVLDRAGEGRIALLGSDQSWLWARGYEGGGPQAELLRRLAHWMMKEPELEEERLFAEPRGQSMQVIHQTLSDTIEDVEITTPSGDTVTLPLIETTPGHFATSWDAPEPGLYRLKSADAEAVVALGPAAPREFIDTIATPDILAPLIDSANGGSFLVENALPSLRTTRAGRPAAGRNWMGLLQRNATRTLNITRQPLLPLWAWLLMIICMTTGAWLYEGRRV